MTICCPPNAGALLLMRRSPPRPVAVIQETTFPSVRPREPSSSRPALACGPRPLDWSGRCRPSDLHVPKVLRQAVLRGRRSASDGGHACPTLRPRDFHHTGVRTGAGEPRMRTGESLPGGGRLLPSSGLRAAFGARVPVVLCGILGSSAPPARVIPAASLVHGLACRTPPWRFLSTRQGGVVPRRLTGTLRTPSWSELPVNLQPL